MYFFHAATAAGASPLPCSPPAPLSALITPMFRAVPAGAALQCVTSAAPDGVDPALPELEVDEQAVTASRAVAAAMTGIELCR
jgi:hypothetical protein